MEFKYHCQNQKNGCLKVSKNKLQKEIIEYLAEHLGWDNEKVHVGSNLKEDLGADSLDTVELAIIFEDKYSIEITEDEVDAIVTAGDIISLVTDKGKE